MATSVWRGYIAFGLISIPVQLFKAARAERVALRQVYRVTTEPPPRPKIVSSQGAGKGRAKREKEPERVEETVAPIRRVASTGEADGVLSDAKILKGYEFEDGRFVTIEDEELKALEA